MDFKLQIPTSEKETWSGQYHRNKETVKTQVLIIYLFTVKFFFPEQSENKHIHTEKVSSLRVKFLKILLKENHQKLKKKKKKSGMKKNMVAQGSAVSRKLPTLQVMSWQCRCYISGLQ